MSQSIPEAQRDATLNDDHDNGSSLKYLSSLSQRTVRPAEKRRSIGDGKQVTPKADRDDRVTTISSRTPTIRPTARDDGGASGSRNERQPAETFKTPSPERPSIRASELAYSTPDAFDAIRAPKSAGLQYESASRKHGWAQTDGVDSEVSTTAASTVWDELNELKSRMRKLEGSGSRSRHYSTTTTTDPSDRPKTATTTTHTTNSASRRSSNNDHLSPSWPSRPRPPSQDISDMHPLLHSALRKARLVIDRHVYTALEASSIDALQMAALARNNSDVDIPSSVDAAAADGPTQIQKQMSRKADNLCRSLTELCIVLCEQHRARSPEHPKQPMHRRPASSDMADGTALVNGNGETDSPLAYLDSRRKLADRIERLQSRHQARNADSLPNRTTATRHSSIVEQSPSSPWTPKPLNRAATTNAYTSARSDYSTAPQDPADLMDEDEDDQNEEKDATLRGPQRAMTDVARRTTGLPGGQTHSPRDLRLSRDYTNRHPLPEGLSPTIRKALEAKNTSAHSLARSDRTARPTATNGIKSPTSVRAQEIQATPIDDDALSPTTNSMSAASRRSFTSTSPERGSTEEPRSERQEKEREDRPRRGSASGRSPRLPPSTGAGLAERLEAKRQQRVASGTASSTSGRTRG